MATRTTISECGRENRRRWQISVLRLPHMRRVFESHTARPVACLKTIFFGERSRQNLM